jgi:hypothetical protein
MCLSCNSCTHFRTSTNKPPSLRQVSTSVLISWQTLVHPYCSTVPPTCHCHSCQCINLLLKVRLHLVAACLSLPCCTSHRPPPPTHTPHPHHQPTERTTNHSIPPTCYCHGCQCINLLIRQVLGEYARLQFGLCVGGKTTDSSGTTWTLVGVRIMIYQHAQSSVSWPWSSVGCSLLTP